MGGPWRRRALFSNSSLILQHSTNYFLRAICDGKYPFVRPVNLKQQLRFLLQLTDSDQQLSFSSAYFRVEDSYPVEDFLFSKLLNSWLSEID